VPTIPHDLEGWDGKLGPLHSGTTIPRAEEHRALVLGRGGEAVDEDIAKERFRAIEQFQLGHAGVGEGMQTDLGADARHGLGKGEP
jgi:hypothetical protein